MKQILLAVWYGLCIIAAAITLPQFLSRVEAYYAPILIEQNISQIWLSPNREKICWDWSFVKVRKAAPVGFRYYLTAANIEDAPVVLLRDGPVQGSERAPGPVADRFCIVLPEGVGPKIELRGYGEYRVSHEMWTVRQPLPTVRWP